MKVAKHQVLLFFGFLTSILQYQFCFTIMGIICGTFLFNVKESDIKERIEIFKRKEYSVIFGFVLGIILTNLFTLIIGILIGSGVLRSRFLYNKQTLNKILKKMSVSVDDTHIYFDF
tara:strand:+ start:1564 stop:1914 length:351 start_codon:yes stop_codon:yes gene_type:complete